MEVDHHAVNSVKSGDDVAIKVADPVREHDGFINHGGCKGSNSIIWKEIFPILPRIGRFGA